MIGTWMKWRSQGRRIRFQVKGEPYSTAKLQRFIDDEQKAHRLNECMSAALISLTGRK
jgi:hypothetical protein